MDSPAMRPLANTSQRRVVIEPHAAPAAYRPGIGLSVLDERTCMRVFTSSPPSVLKASG